MLGVAVTGVSLGKSMLMLAVGASQTLTATITPANASNKNITWSSSNMGVARVSAGGMVMAVSTGTATITVTTADGNRIAECEVTITNTPTAVEAQALPKLAVYPNPVGDVLYITDASVGNVEIYSITGALVLVSGRASINIARLPAGIYVVKAGGRAAKVVKR